MNSYRDCLHFLYGLQKFGMKLGLSGIRALMRSLGNPHLKFPSVHIAGTNGKGSTAAMLAAIFTAAGYKTGLYTSPHLVDYRERIRINGRPIPKADVIRLTRLIKSDINRLRSTFFEATTAIAFQYFAESEADIAIIETGLGGRLDATNILQPLVSVITSIGMEHAEILGGTLERIVGEKAGIIKRGVPCVSGVSSRVGERILRETCKRRRSSFRSVDGCKIRVKSSGIEGLTLDVTGPEFQLRDLKVSLPGTIQARNAALAILTVQEICSRSLFAISEEDLRDGFSRLQRLTGLQGRLSILNKIPLVIADVAHNPQAALALSGSIRSVGIKQVDLVFGVLKDKDYISMIRALRPITGRTIVVVPKTERARRGGELAMEFERNSVPARIVEDVPRGVRQAIDSARNGVPILVTGSNFVVAEALASLSGKKYLTINQ